ncbi:MAG: tetratricopeptide repeat protein [Deltaproteobacteria bacterium]|nr:tetratricopeptide repeat protein [Deltaproteobacteria bacterium]
MASLAQVRIGEAYRKMGDSNTAIVEFMKAIYLYPGQRRQVDTALLQAGEIYVEQGKWAEARRVCSKLMETSRSEAVRERARNILKEIDRRIGNQ